MARTVTGTPAPHYEGTLQASIAGGRYNHVGEVIREVKFSVAIPAYKPQFLKEAVASVVTQTFPGWELIVVDDCSPTDLHALVAPFLSDPRVRFYRNERNFGAADVVDNWNKCLDYCTGDYVICMGDDDRLLPKCLQELRDACSRHPGLGVYYIQTELIDERGTVVETCKRRPEYESALDMLERRWQKDSRQFIGNLCFDLRLLRKQGGFFKLPLAWGSDDISFFRAAREGIACTRLVGFQYRSNSLSLSADDDFETKAKAMVQASAWFEKALEAHTPPSAQLKRLQKRREPYFRYLCGEYVKTDCGRHPARVRYWLQHRQGARLSGAMVLFWAFKGFILHGMGRL